MVLFVIEKEPFSYTEAGSFWFSGY